MMKSVTYFAVPNLPLIEPGDDLAGKIVDALKQCDLPLVSGDIVVVAQKVVSKAENRYVDLDSVVPSERALQLAPIVGKEPRYLEVILSESDEIIRHRPGIVITAHRLGFVMANAGIDESNIEHPQGRSRVLLLPVNPDSSAADLKSRFDQEFSANVGVIINDSFGRPWRNGVVGVALGAAGVPSLIDMIGAPDMFGRAMRVTEISVADEIASGASLLMGQGAEGLPVVVVRGASFKAPIRPASDLLRPRERDMFR